MNKNQINGSAKNYVGKVQEEAGILARNKVQRDKGMNKQVSGNAEKTPGEASELINIAHHPL